MPNETFMAFENDQLTFLLVNKRGARVMDQATFVRKVVDDQVHYHCSGDTPDDKDGGPEHIYLVTAERTPVEVLITWPPQEDGMAVLRLIELATGAPISDPGRPSSMFQVSFALPNC
jgi:hypothetical protein